MLEKIDHIGVAVFDLGNAAKIYEQAFGLQSEGIEYVPEQKVRVQKFKIGRTRIELLEPQSDDSPISKFLEKRGEGIHHICYAVSDLDDSIKKLKLRGLEFIGQPTSGSNNKRVIFIHPKSVSGVLIELVENQPQSQRSVSEKE